MVQPGSPQDVGLSSLVDIARQHEEQVGEPVGVFERCRVNRFLVGDFGHIPLGPAHHRTCVMQMRRGAAAAREHNAVERGQTGIERVDPLLDPRYLAFADPQRLDFSVLSFRTAEIAAEITEVVLNVAQDVANIAIGTYGNRLHRGEAGDAERMALDLR